MYRFFTVSVPDVYNGKRKACRREVRGGVEDGRGSLGDHVGIVYDHRPCVGRHRVPVVADTNDPKEGWDVQGVGTDSTDGGTTETY